MPHRFCAGKPVENPGLNALSMLEQDADKKIFILFNTDPILDHKLGGELLKDLQKATVIAITPFASESIKQYADIILPIGVFAQSLLELL